MEISDGAGKVAEKCVIEALNILSPMRSDSKSPLEFDQLMRECNAIQAVEAAIEDTDDEPDTQMQYKICGGMNNHYWILSNIENIPPIEQKTVNGNFIESGSMLAVDLQKQQDTQIDSSQGKVELGKRGRPRGIYISSDEFDKVNEGNQQPISMASASSGRVLRSHNSSKENRFLNSDVQSSGHGVADDQFSVARESQTAPIVPTAFPSRNVLSDMEDYIVDVDTISEDGNLFGDGDETEPPSTILSQNISRTSNVMGPAKRIGLSIPSGSKKNKHIPHVPVQLGLRTRTKLSQGGPNIRQEIKTTLVPPEFTLENIYNDSLMHCRRDSDASSVDSQSEIASPTINGTTVNNANVESEVGNLSNVHPFTSILRDSLPVGDNTSRNAVALNEEIVDKRVTSESVSIQKDDDTSVPAIEEDDDVSVLATQKDDEDVASPATRKRDEDVASPVYSPAGVEAKVVLQDSTNNSINVPFKQKAKWSKSFNTGIVSEPTSRDDEQSQPVVNEVVLRRTRNRDTQTESVKRRSVADEDTRVKRKSARLELLQPTTSEVQNEDESSAQSIPHGKKITVIEDIQICAPSIENAQQIVHSPTISETIRLSDIVVVPEVKVPNGNEQIDEEYDDLDPLQNELIEMERKYVNSEPALHGGPMPKREKMKQFRKDCERCSLPPPMDLDDFDGIDWNYVSVCDEARLAPGYKSLTMEELEKIPRRHAKFPFCHPGPVQDEDHKSGGWYYADGIVQELKFIGVAQTFYNVRWIGYEDVYNTLETESCLRGKAILILHQRQDIFMSSQESGPLLLRRSVRNMNQVATTFMEKSVSQNESFARAMVLLDEYLKVEELNGRFMPEIGFYSCENLNAALKSQLDFTENIFMNIIKDLHRPEYYVSLSIWAVSLVTGKTNT